MHTRRSGVVASPSPKRPPILCLSARPAQPLIHMLPSNQSQTFVPRPIGCPTARPDIAHRHPRSQGRLVVEAGIGASPSAHPKIYGKAYRLRRAEQRHAQQTALIIITKAVDGIAVGAHLERLRLAESDKLIRGGQSDARLHARAHPALRKCGRHDGTAAIEHRGETQGCPLDGRHRRAAAEGLTLDRRKGEDFPLLGAERHVEEVGVSRFCGGVGAGGRETADGGALVRIDSKPVRTARVLPTLDVGRA
eukprot:scaffold100000_cov27-Tisochrysis_lutea.AAC.4